MPELAVDGQRTDDGGERQYPADQEPGVPGGGGGRQHGLDEGNPVQRELSRRKRGEFGNECDGGWNGQ